MKARQYVWGLVCGVSLSTAFVGAFSRVVDPFWYYRDIELAGINQQKGQAARAYERYVKPQVLAREAPEAVIIGNSLAEIGFPPTHAGFTQDGAWKSYNFGIAGAKWERVQCYYDFAVTHAPLKRIVIGILPEPLPRVDCTGKLPEVDGFNESQLLFSRQAFAESLKTLLGQRRIKPDYTKAGLYFYNRGHPGIVDRFKTLFTGNDCSRDAPHKPADGLPAATPNLDLAGLRHIIRTAAAKNIELHIIVYPKHALALELDHYTGQDKEHWAVLHAIARMAGQERGNFSIWEFNRYNAYTTEPIRGNTPTYWQDPDHFNHELGGIIFDTVFTNTPSGLGAKISTSTIDAAYRAYVDSRDTFVTQHPGFLEEFASFNCRD